VISVAGKTGVVTLVEGDIANLVTDLAACEKTANKGAASGYASLDSSGKVPSAQLPGGGGGGGQTGTPHSFVYDGSSTFDGINMQGGQWSHLGGTFAVDTSGTSSGAPGCYRQTSASASYSQISEDVVATQVALAIFSRFQCYLAAGVLSGATFWHGLSSGFAGALNAANPAANLVAFRYVDGTDSHWKAYVSTDATHFTVADTGITPDGNFHQFAIDQDSSGNLLFSIDGTTVATIASGSTGIPLANTAMYDLAWVGHASATAYERIHSLIWWSKF